MADFARFSPEVQNITKKEVDLFFASYSGNTNEIKLHDVTVKITTHIRKTYMGDTFPVKAVKAYLERQYVMKRGHAGVSYFSLQGKTN